MVASVNGKTLPARWHHTAIWPELDRSFSAFYNALGSQAWLCGRVTMQEDFAAGPVPALPSLPATATVVRPAYVGNPAATSFALAVDAQGTLGWDGNDVEGDHLVVLLSEQVSDEYLYYLQQRRISYLLAGQEHIDFQQALTQLSALFPIQTLVLQGGGHLNGSLLQAGLIDELSLLIAPVADATPGPTAFELVARLREQPLVADMTLTSVEQLAGGLVWLRYTVSPPA